MKLTLVADFASFSDDQLTMDDFLGGVVKLLQPAAGYRAATDPVFLAASCPARAGQSVLELGCGAGAVLICLAARVPDLTLTGIEMQHAYADLARRNAVLNGETLRILTGDLRNASILTNAGTFDHVVMNPPYYGPGTASSDGGRKAALQEETSLDLWIDAGLRRLKPKGYITVIHLAERVADILELLNPKAGAIEIKPLAARDGRHAKRVIIRARKGSNAMATLCNPLILHEGAHHLKDSDSYPEAVRRVLRKPNELSF